MENLATPDTSNMVTRHALSEALSQHEEVLQRHEGTFMSQSESLTALESGLAKSNSAVEVLDSRMGGLGQELDDLKAKMQEMEVHNHSEIIVYLFLSKRLTFCFMFDVITRPIQLAMCI